MAEITQLEDGTERITFDSPDPQSMFSLGWNCAQKYSDCEVTIFPSVTINCRWKKEHQGKPVAEVIGKPIDKSLQAQVEALREALANFIELSNGPKAPSPKISFKLVKHDFYPCSDEHTVIGPRKGPDLEEKRAYIKALQQAKQALALTPADALKRAELDRAVVQAAERWYIGYTQTSAGSLQYYTEQQGLERAVEARREGLK